MKNSHRIFDITIDILFAVIPALMFMPIAYLGLTVFIDNMHGTRLNSSLETLKLIGFGALTIGSFIGTSSLLCGLYKKIRFNSEEYGVFIRFGAFTGVACLYIVLCFMLYHHIYISVLLMVPIFIGLKYSVSSNLLRKSALKWLAPRKNA